MGTVLVHLRRLNLRHKRALAVLLTTLALDIAFGSLYAVVQRIPEWHGLYCSLGVSTTLGCDVAPAGWAGYALMIAMMFTVVPMLASVFSFFTSGLTADHAEELHEKMKQHVTEVRHGKPEGGPAGAGQADPGQRVPADPGGGQPARHD